MDVSQLERWLLSSRVRGHPRTIGELLPDTLPCGFAIENDPEAATTLDASGFLSLSRLGTVVSVCADRKDRHMVVAYWDGWSGIADRIEAYSRPSFALSLPNRRYLAVEATSHEMMAMSQEFWPYLGPSIVVSSCRSWLLFSDVDWPVTYLGFSSREIGEMKGRALSGAGLDRHNACAADTPLFGYGPQHSG